MIVEFLNLLNELRNSTFKALESTLERVSSYVMRVLRLAFNFAVHEYRLENGQSIISVNPVKYLYHTRS